MQAAAAGPDPRAAALRIAFLRNSLMRLPDFRQSLSVIQPTAGNEAVPFTRFLLLPRQHLPRHRPTSRSAFSLRRSPIQELRKKPKLFWIGAISLTGAGAPVITVANSHTVKLASGAAFPFPGGSANEPLEPESILPVDFNYDFKMDLVLAGEGGVRFLRQESASSFTDVTEQTKLPSALLMLPIPAPGRSM